MKAFLCKTLGLLAIAAAVLSGCNAAAVPPGGASPNAASASLARGWISPQAKSAPERLYVGGGTSGNIDVFALSHGGTQGKLVAQLQYVPGAGGMHFDKFGNLYIGVSVSGGSGGGGPEGWVAVIAKGDPYATYFVTGYNVADIAWNSNELLYSANYSPDGYFDPGSISVIDAAHNVLRTLALPDASEAVGVTVNPRTHDVFTTYSGAGSGGRIAVLRAGRGKPHTLGVTFGSPWGIAADRNGNLLVADDGPGNIDVYTRKGKLLNSFAVEGTPLYFAFNKDYSLLYVTNFDNYDVEVYTYPGEKMVGSIHAPDWQSDDWPTGVAIWPAPYVSGD